MDLILLLIEHYAWWLYGRCGGYPGLPDAPPGSP